MGEFEKDIRKIFENVEFQPSDNVWSGVETKLKMGKKKGILLNWTRYGVAAAITTVLGIGYLWYDQVLSVPTSVPSKELAKETEGQETGNETNAKATDKEKEENIKEDDIKITQLTENDVTKVETLAKKGVVNSVSGTPKLAEVISKNISTDLDNEAIVDRKLMPIDNINRLELFERLTTITKQLEWRNKYLVPSPDFEFKEAVIIDRGTREKSLLASLAGGSFDPNFDFGTSQNESVVASFDNPSREDVTVQNGSNMQEYSFSVGGGMVLPIGKRLSLRGGLHFSQYKFSNTSNAYTEEQGGLLPVYLPVGFDNGAVSFVGEYNINTTLSTLSVPISASYQFLSLGRFTTSVNLGVGLDYIASYRISGDLNFLETRKVKFSENELFDRFNLNALTGLEFGYRLNDKFGLIGEAFFRKYLSNKNSSFGVVSSPAFYGFGLSLNYFIGQ